MAKSRALLVWCVCVFGMELTPLAAFGHAGHDVSAYWPQGDSAGQAESTAGMLVTQADPAQLVSGQGRLTFRVLYTASHLPQEAQDVLVKAHGGFAVDRRAGKGDVYFALPGAGIIHLSGDLRIARMLPSPEEVKGTNMHNTTIWYDGQGTPFLVFPANDTGKVITTTESGQLVHVLDGPGANMDFDEPVVNAYFAAGEKFVPTDVEYLNGRYYITTGYSNLDYVLTAIVRSTDPFAAEWYDLVFGGKGEGPGQFGTGHGITVSPDKKRIHVADRPNSEIDRFTRFGRYVDTLSLPKGSFPCDVDFEGPYTVVGCLHGPDREKGAPIYIVENGEVVSTIMPREELGLANFTHIHNAVMVQVEGKYYVIAQAWNPGDFAILEQVTE